MTHATVVVLAVHLIVLETFVLTWVGLYISPKQTDFEIKLSAVWSSTRIYRYVCPRDISHSTGEHVCRCVPRV